jgi:hypothetical protein
MDVPLFLEISGKMNAARFSISPEAADMNRRFQMQGGKNWILPK